MEAVWLTLHSLPLFRLHLTPLRGAAGLCALDFGEQMGSGLLLRLLPQAMQSHRDEHHGGFLTLFRFDVHS